LKRRNSPFTAALCQAVDYLDATDKEQELQTTNEHQFTESKKTETIYKVGVH
jgi:hypothetical protein